MMTFLILLPLLGIWISGKPLARYLEFPPSERYIAPASFSWWVFLVLAVGILAVFGSLLWKSLVPGHNPDSDRFTNRPFPLWGWAGLVLGGVFWILSWTRFEWFAALQRHTFTPLWLCYIVVVNALTWKRTGACMLTDRKAYLALLFVLSAAFWWYFEYLNRFVQNWFYEGIQDMSAWQYFLFATPPFSTVLPAVLGTFDLLKRGTSRGVLLDQFIVVNPHHPRGVAWIVLILSSAGLLAVGIWPDYLFPLLWMAPLFILTSLQAVCGEQTIFEPLARGQWRDLCLLGLAALVCGFFWEMWNVYSLAKWTYAVPFVQRFHLFEMPILGYAGYLPFGLECALIARLFLSPPTTVQP